MQTKVDIVQFHTNLPPRAGLEIQLLQWAASAAEAHRRKQPAAPWRRSNFCSCTRSAHGRRHIAARMGDCCHSRHRAAELLWICCRPHRPQGCAFVLAPGPLWDDSRGRTCSGCRLGSHLLNRSRYTACTALLHAGRCLLRSATRLLFSEAFSQAHCWKDPCTAWHWHRASHPASGWQPSEQTSRGLSPSHMLPADPPPAPGRMWQLWTTRWSHHGQAAAAMGRGGNVRRLRHPCNPAASSDTCRAARNCQGDQWTHVTKVRWCPKNSP
mmetsp:Transcript_24519/g.56907  ORF Transcript_24519/g.56907 Transcript_24519/m.56907 type:complete len:269 (-) Transcript_24519:101-907(-)